MAATKASAGLPQAGDEYDLYRSFPAFQDFCSVQGDRLLHWYVGMSRFPVLNFVGQNLPSALERHSGGVSHSAHG